MAWFTAHRNGALWLTAHSAVMTAGGHAAVKIPPSFPRSAYDYFAAGKRAEVAKSLRSVAPRGGELSDMWLRVEASGGKSL